MGRKLADWLGRLEMGLWELNGLELELEMGELKLGWFEFGEWELNGLELGGWELELGGCWVEVGNIVQLFFFLFSVAEEQYHTIYSCLLSLLQLLIIIFIIIINAHLILGS